MTGWRRISVLGVTACLAGCAAPGHDDNFKEIEDLNAMQDESLGRASLLPACRADGSPTVRASQAFGPRTTAGAADGLDRSHWTRITVGPSPGTTSHHPAYFRDWPLWHEQPPIHDGFSLEAALSGSRAANYDSLNLANVLVQPVNFGIDLLWLSARVLAQPPLQPVTAP